ncbi:hypothetical protein [uncultured Jatrophihabitans sp.]|uniref:hypothetical protein n=1 Tax=uncultured Jatrophihabitans sp. TaxID=1610747 RepID=UPI0035CB32DD
MGMCSINVAEMRSLVSSLESAESTVRSNVGLLQSTLSELMLEPGEVARATPVASWVSDELVPTRRRLAMAEALQAATPNRSNYVNFDESAISKLTPAQAAVKAKQAVNDMKTGNTKALLALLSTEGYDPYFAKVFAQQTSPKALEEYIRDNFGSDGRLNGDVDARQYEEVLTGLGQTLSLATRGTGDLSLGKKWTDNYVRWMTMPPEGADEAVNDRRYDLGGRGVLMMIMARGNWSTAFLKHATTVIKAFDKDQNDDVFWYPPASMGTAVTPQGKTFTDPIVALMSALSHNPAVAKWAFTSGKTVEVPLHGKKVAVNAFLQHVLSRDYEFGGSSTPLLALQAAINGDKTSPVMLDVRTLSESAKEAKAERDAEPWYEKWGHDILNVIGLIPFVGDLANAPNAAWYAAEGDWADAGITTAGMIPFIGDAALGGKLLSDGSKLAKVLKVLRIGGLTEKELRDGVDLSKLEQEVSGAGAVINLTDKAALEEALKTPHPGISYEFDGIRYTTDADGNLKTISGNAFTSGKMTPAQLDAVHGAIRSQLQREADGAWKAASDPTSARWQAYEAAHGGKPPSAAVQGTWAHTDLSSAVGARLQKTFPPGSGYRVQSEISFGDRGQVVSPGAKGSVRPDVIVEREVTLPNGRTQWKVDRVYDLKTGNAKITNKWARTVEQRTGVPRSKIQEIKPGP